MIFTNSFSNFLQLRHADNTVDKTVDNTAQKNLFYVLLHVQIFDGAPIEKLIIIQEVF